MKPKITVEKIIVEQLQLVFPTFPGSGGVVRGSGKNIIPKVTLYSHKEKRTSFAIRYTLEVPLKVVSKEEEHEGVKDVRLAMSVVGLVRLTSVGSKKVAAIKDYAATNSLPIILKQFDKLVSPIFQNSLVPGISFSQIKSKEEKKKSQR